MTEPTTTNRTTRKVYDPAEEWLSIVESLEVFLEEAVEPHKRFEYSDDGIDYIPFTNKQWIQLTGKETPPHTGLRWLKQGQVFKDKKGYVHQSLIKCYSAISGRIVWAMTRNTLICSKLANIPIHLSAVNNTIHYYLQKFTDCPLDLLNRVTDTLAFVTKINIDTFSDCTLDGLKTINKKERMGQGATDYTARENLRQMLIKRGIGRLQTRQQQEKLIDSVLSLDTFSHLKQETKTSILKWLWARNLLKSSHLSKTDRVSEIMWKQANKVALTPAERKFKCKFKELFK